MRKTDTYTQKKTEINTGDYSPAIIEKPKIRRLIAQTDIGTSGVTKASPWVYPFIFALLMIGFLFYVNSENKRDYDRTAQEMNTKLESALAIISAEVTRDSQELQKWTQSVDAQINKENVEVQIKQGAFVALQQEEAIKDNTRRAAHDRAKELARRGR